MLSLQLTFVPVSSEVVETAHTTARSASSKVAERVCISPASFLLDLGITACRDLSNLPDCSCPSPACTESPAGSLTSLQAGQLLLEPSQWRAGSGQGQSAPTLQCLRASENLLVALGATILRASWLLFVRSLLCPCPVPALVLIRLKPALGAPAADIVLAASCCL